MRIETSLAKNIRIADDKAKYDASCKRLLSEKMILAWIMKSCLQEYQDCDIKEIAEKYIEGSPQVAEIAVAPDETNAPTLIQGMGNEDTSMTEGVITYDIRFFAITPVSGEKIRLIINVEAQNDYYPGYPLTKRSIYYCSRLISSQYGTEFTESHYEKIKKVYSIWICMNPPKYRENSITRYVITEENLIGTVKEAKANYDLMTAIMICLGKPEDEEYAGILKLLNVLLSAEASKEERFQVLEKEFEIEMTQELEREVSLMCNLSKGVEEKGIQKGIQQGMEQGIQGMVSALKELDVPYDIILQKLQEKFHLSEEEARKYLQTVK